MIPYLIPLTVSFFYATLNFNKKHVYSPFLLGSIFFLFVLLVAFTDGNGLDWYGSDETEGYAMVDYRALGFEELIRYEPGFILVNIILGNFHLFLFVMSIICFLLVWDVIKKNCSYKYIGLFVYIATMTLYCYMGVYRHAIAQTILIYSWNYIDDKKKLSIIILLACLFHYSAAVAFLYFLIPQKSYFSRKICLLLFLLAIIIRPVVQPLMAWLLALTSFLLPGQTAGKINLYMNGDEVGSGISIPLLIFKLFVFICAFFYLKTRKTKINCFLVNAYFISIILYITITIAPTFARLVHYFSCTIILLIPITIDRMKDTSKAKRSNGAFIPVFYFFAIVVLHYYIYIKTILDFSDVYLPYKSILF